MFLSIDKKPRLSIAAKDSEGNAIPYGQLCDGALALGAYIEPRSVVFCLCKNNVGFLLGYISFVEKSAVPLMLNAKIDRELLHQLMGTYTPAYIWCPCTENFDGEQITECYGYRLIKLKDQPYPIHENLQLLMTTSGSTGSPKLVRYKKGNLEANAKNVALAFGWTAEERPICDLGMQYTMGLNVINTHLYVGATVLLTDHNLMSGEFWDYIKAERATNFTGVPFSYEILTRLRFQAMELPYLTTLAEGGGKLTDKRYIELAEYAQRTGKRFIPTFGTTETSARMAMLPAELAREKVGSIGRAIPEGTLFLRDEQGNVLTDAVAEGELCYSGPNVTMGYAVTRDELMKGDDWNGTYYTGDLARRDADGCYYITGRMSRFLKLLSYRVSLDQCERLIQEEFNVECACTGSDERMDIYIVEGQSTEGAITEAIQDFVCKKTGLYKTLFKIFVIDSIPRNDSGKIKYKELGKPKA